jgi:phosphoglycolate phosphatase-like HAD superfamily hydrolase
VNWNTPGAPESPADLLGRATYLLFDFDGPLVDLFALGQAPRIARELFAHLEERLGYPVVDLFPNPGDPHGLLAGLRVTLQGPVGMAGRAAEPLVRETELLLVEAEREAVRTAEITDGAEALLQSLMASRRGTRRFAITSNNSAAAIDDLLAQERATVLRAAFQRQVHGRDPDPDRMKPDPGCLIRALDGLGCRYPDEALLIGDSGSDLEAAKQVGIPFLGYGATDAKRAKLLESGARQLVADLRELLPTAPR